MLRQKNLLKDTTLMNKRSPYRMGWILTIFDLPVPDIPARITNGFDFSDK